MLQTDDRQTDRRTDDDIANVNVANEYIVREYKKYPLSLPLIFQQYMHIFARNFTQLLSKKI